MCRICPLPTHTTIRLCASVLPALANLSAESIVSGLILFEPGPGSWDNDVPPQAWEGPSGCSCICSLRMPAYSQVVQVGEWSS